MTIKTNEIRYSLKPDANAISKQDLLQLYKENQWSAAKKLDVLHNALFNSHSLVSAHHGDTLVGIGNAISDGYMVVYYPHLLVLPRYHQLGIGKQLMRLLMHQYPSFHQHILISDQDAVRFYEKMGFERAGKTTPMWIYAGSDH